MVKYWEMLQTSENGKSVAKFMKCNKCNTKERHYCQMDTLKPETTKIKLISFLETRENKRQNKPKAKENTEGLVFEDIGKIDKASS